MDCFAALRPMLKGPRNINVGDSERMCRTCLTVKPLSEFYGRKRKSYRCKRCDINRIVESRRGQ